LDFECFLLLLQRLDLLVGLSDLPISKTHRVGL
jgi:hypothetical protein